jgi:serine/threonine protein kinase
MLSSIDSNSYSFLLSNYNIEYTETYLYLEAERQLNFNGWAFFIPISKSEFISLLEKLVPFLDKNKIPFAICKDESSFNKLTNDLVGINFYGKVICIYPSDQFSLQLLALDLISITEAFKGGIVLSATRLGELLFTEYLGDIRIATNGNETVQDEDSPEYNFSRLNKQLAWPFPKIIPSPEQVIKIGDLIGGKYRIQEILSSSVKGIVAKASYTEGMILKRKKNCLVKIGLRGMCRDNFGRDIFDRLKWQEKLQNDLCNIIAIPHVLDAFDDKEKSFLIMDFIDGQTLQQFQNSLIGFVCWFDLNNERRITILNQILEAVRMVGKLHEKGYLHRDITFINIMLDKKNKLFFIDLELAYSIKYDFPDPPFSLGTIGLMSPEQESKFPPDVTQDIFYIGTLLLLSVTRLLPQKFDKRNDLDLFNRLLYFTSDKELVKLITLCISEDSLKRPDINHIITELESIIFNYSRTEKFVSHQIISTNQINIVIQKSINNLGNLKVLNEFGLWGSSEDKIFTNSEESVLKGIYNGISGILYLISIVKQHGFDVTDLETISRRHFEYLLRGVLSSEKRHLGLYNGIHGVCIGLSAAVKIGIVEKSEVVLNIRECFELLPASLDISNGIAGVGVSLIHCSDFFDQEEFQQKLIFIANILIENQMHDGGWVFANNDFDVKESFTGFEIGVAGIVWFLFEVGELLNSVEITNSAMKGIQWIIDKSLVDGKRYNWGISTNCKDKAMLFSGSVGISFMFIKAFEITGNTFFRKIVSDLLNEIPQRIVIYDDRFSTGLPGLGEVYLEAFRVLKENIWYERAEWIAGIYLNTTFNGDNFAWWIQHDRKKTFVDLLTGNGGIIHFLLRFIKFNEVNFNIFGYQRNSKSNL